MKKIAQGFTSEIYRVDDTICLKLYKSDFAFIAEKEFNILKNLYNCPYSIPDPIKIYNIDTRTGYTMNYIKGLSLLAIIENDIQNIGKYGEFLGVMHAQVHGETRYRGTPENTGSIFNKLDRRRFKLQRFIDKLETRKDSLSSKEKTLCHNDFHPGNILNDKDHYWIIDWNGLICGDFHADIAKTIVLIETAPPGIAIGNKGYTRREDFLTGYVQGYNKIRKIDHQRLKMWKSIRVAELIILDLPVKEQLERELEKNLL